MYCRRRIKINRVDATGYAFGWSLGPFGSPLKLTVTKRWTGNARKQKKSTARREWSTAIRESGRLPVGVGAFAGRRRGSDDFGRLDTGGGYRAGTCAGYFRPFILLTQILRRARIKSMRVLRAGGGSGRLMRGRSYAVRRGRVLCVTFLCRVSGKPHPFFGLINVAADFIGGWVRRLSSGRVLFRSQQGRSQIRCGRD